MMTFIFTSVPWKAKSMSKSPAMPAKDSDSASAVAPSSETKIVRMKKRPLSVSSNWSCR
jgi:hypothetical protein